MADSCARLPAQYFDGFSGRARPASAWVDSGQLHWAAEGLAPQGMAADRARWPERLRHGQRHIQLPDGGVLAFDDASAFDAWAAAAGRSGGTIVRWQQSWRLALLALALLAVLIVGLWRWGIPAAAGVVARWLPEAMQAEMGAKTLAYLDKEWLKPSDRRPTSVRDPLPRWRQGARAERLRAARRRHRGDRCAGRAARRRAAGAGRSARA